MDVERSDEALMRDWAAGEADAFEPLYARHRIPLFRVLLRQVRVQATAEDLFHDVWQRITSARGSPRSAGRFAIWLYRVASDRLAEHWRRTGRRSAGTDVDSARPERSAAPVTPNPALSVFEERRRLQRSLEALAPERRELLVLRLEQAMSLDEIAAITGIGRDAVASRLRESMEPLRAPLVRGGEPEGTRASGADRAGALDAHERALARVMRALPAGDPPTRLDAKILSMARDAVVATPDRPDEAVPGRRGPWLIRVALAAGLIVGAGLAWSWGSGA